MKSMARLSLVIGTMLSAGFAPMALAQGVAPQDSEANVGLADIVVVARKTAESLQTVPVAVSAFSAEMLEKQSITSVTQLQTTTPNLTFSSAVAQPGSATVFIRGQGSSDGLIAIDNAVGSYINGVYAARSTGGAFDMVDVQRVEILRGPQGTLFGRNTTGGAINIIPNEPSDRREGSFRVDYGNFDTMLVRGVYNLPLTDDLAIRVAGQHREHSGYARNVPLNREVNDANSDFVRATLKYAPAGSGFTALISADYSHFKNKGEATGLKSFTPQGPGSPQQLLVAACNGTAPLPALNALQAFCPAVARGNLADYVYGQNGNNNIYEVYQNTASRGMSQSHGVSAVLDYEISDAATLKSTTAWRGVKLDALSDNDGTPFLLSGGIEPFSGNVINQHQFSEELQLSGDIGPVKYILGGFYFVENGTDRSRSASLFPLNPVIGIVDATIRNQSLAGFGQLIYEIADGVRLTGGLRYTQDKRKMESRNRDLNFFTNAVASSIPTLVDGDASDPYRATFERSFNYWSYLVSADYQATRDIFLYAKTSRSQRSGGFNTRAVEGGNPPISFSPEVVVDYEVGTKIQLFDRRARLNLAVFNSDVDNVQRTLTGVSGARLVAGVANAAKARIRGLEAELTVVPVEGLTIGGNFGYTDAKYKRFINVIDGSDLTNSAFIYTPKYTVGVTGDYEYKIDGSGTLKLHADYGWRSKQYSVPLALSASQRVGLTPEQISAGNRAIQDTAKIPSYGLLNARIAFQLEEPNVELAVYGLNLTKQDYFSRTLALEGTALGVTAYTPGDPRTYGVSATFRF